MDIRIVLIIISISLSEIIISYVVENLESRPLAHYLGLLGKLNLTRYNSVLFVPRNYCNP